MARWTTVSFSSRAALCLVMVSIIVREHRLLEAALCGDSPVFEGEPQPVPFFGPTATGCGRPRFVLSWYSQCFAAGSAHTHFSRTSQAATARCALLCSLLLARTVPVKLTEAAVCRHRDGM